jgi:GDSL-like Lipase/Acylhydrolase family
VGNLDNFVATSGGIQKQPTQQLSVILNIGANWVFSVLINGVLIGTVTEPTPVAAAVYPCYYLQKDAATTGTDTNNIGLKSFSASEDLINIRYSGDSIFTSDYLTGQVGSPNSIPAALYDQLQGLAVVTGNAVSGRGLTGNNGYAGALIPVAGDFLNRASALFKENIALVQGGTNDFLAPNAAPATVLAALNNLVANLKTAASAETGATAYTRVATITPLHTNGAGGNNTSVDTYVASLKAASNITLVDLTVDANLNVNLPAAGTYFNDGVHPTTTTSIPLIGGYLKSALGPVGGQLTSLLAGLPTPTNLTILATDQQIAALAKLQGQVTAAKAALSISPLDIQTRVPVSNTLWFATVRQALVATGATIVANSNTNTGIKFQPWVADRAGIVDGLALNVAVLLAASTFRLAVYRSGADGFPNITAGPLWSSPALDGATTGVKGNAVGVGGIIGTLQAGGAFSVALGEVLWIAIMASVNVTLGWNGWSLFPGPWFTAAANGTSLPGVAQDHRANFRQIVFAYNATAAFPNTGVTTVAAATVTGPLNFLVRYQS